MMTTEQRLGSALPLMSELDRSRIVRRQKAQRKLREVRDEIGKAIGRSAARQEFDS